MEAFDPHLLLPERFGLRWDWSAEECWSALAGGFKAERTDSSLSVTVQSEGHDYPVALSIWRPATDAPGTASHGPGLQSISTILYDPADFYPEQFVDEDAELPDDEAFWSMVHEEHEAELVDAREAWQKALQGISTHLGQDALTALKPDAGWLPVDTEALAGWRTSAANFELELSAGGGDWPLLYVQLRAVSPAAPFAFDRPEQPPRHPYEALFSPPRHR